MAIIYNFLRSATAAAAMIAMPVVASAAPVQGAQSLSVASSIRADAGSESEDGQFFGGGFIIPAVIVVAIGLGLYFALEEDDSSTSP